MSLNIGRLELERQFCQTLGAYAAGLKTHESLWDQLLDRRLDTDQAIESARKHGLGPAAYRLSCEPRSKNLISKWSYQQLLKDQAVDIMRRDVVAKALDPLLLRFSSEDVPVIPLKGILYANRLYDPAWLRTFSDVDLLARVDDWPRVLAIFKSLNYEPLHNYGPRPPSLTKDDIPQHIEFRSPTGFVFDIALDIFKLGLRSSLSDLAWSFAQDYSLEGRKTLTLSSEFEILNISVHLHRHGFNRLIWFVDLALAIQRLRPDWDEVARLARLGGLNTSIFFSLTYLNRFFGPLVEAPVIDKFYPGRIRCRVFAKHWPEPELLAFNGARDGAIVFRRKLFRTNLVANLALTGQTLSKAAYFARKLWPTHEFLRRKYAVESNRAYLTLYLKRCGEYFKKPPGARRELSGQRR